MDTNLQAWFFYLGPPDSQAWAWAHETITDDVLECDNLMLCVIDKGKEVEHLHTHQTMELYLKVAPHFPAWNSNMMSYHYKLKFDFL